MPAADEMTLKDLAQWAQGTAKKLRTQGFKRPLLLCRQVVVAETKQNFVGQRTPDGAPWPAVRMRVRGDVGQAQALRDRGLLFGSLFSRGGKGHVETITDKFLLWGTNLWYAHVHQEGKEIRPKGGKALAIPLTIQAYRAGWPRNFPGELVLLWKKGNTTGILAEIVQKGRGKKKAQNQIPHYLLVPRSRIPRREFVGLNQTMVDRCVRVFQDFGFQTIVA